MWKQQNEIFCRFFSDVSGFAFYHVVLIHQTPWIHMVMHCFYSCFIVTLYGHIYYDTSVGLLLLYYRLGTVNSKSFIGKVLLRIKWKFKLTVYFKHGILG